MGSMLASTETAEREYVGRREAWLLDLGRIAYGDAWTLQKVLAVRRSEDAITDGLILVEHDHVITLGRRGKKEDVLEPGLPIFEVERGGEATYHGPGQLVGYPILKLPDRLEVKRLVTDLEEVLVRACADFGIEATRDGPERGVWIENRKIASIGLAVQKNVTFHGFAINVTTDLSYFLKIRPCGHAGTIMTSMEKQVGRNVDLEDVKASVIVHFQDVFGVTLRRVNLSELIPKGTPPRAGPGRR
jgi:lipoate-protein ligase B